MANFIGETNFLEAEMVSAKNGTARLRLPSGKQVSAALAEGAPTEGTVSIVVRPEHAGLTTVKSKSALTGRLENVVYFGTDTHYHLRLDGGEPFIVRQQNSRDAEEKLTSGAEVGIEIGKNAVQVLRD